MGRARSRSTLLAGFLRFWHLGTPHAFLFDETYYAKDAWSLWHHGYVTGYVDKRQRQDPGRQPRTGSGPSQPSMIVHPEVGKWLIGLGEHLFGMDPAGWRVASAVVGTLMVDGDGPAGPPAHRVDHARRASPGCCCASTGWSSCSRGMALLDIFVAFFLLCAVSCLVADRDWGTAADGAAGRAGERRVDGRPAGVRCAGCCGGRGGSAPASDVRAGVRAPSGTRSSRWRRSGCWCWLWDTGARRAIGVRRPALKSLVVDALPAFGYLVVVALVVYVRAGPAG